MYKSTESEQIQLSFFQFNASCGMQLDTQNEWVKDGNRLPWKVWESSYASMFPGNKGNVGLIISCKTSYESKVVILCFLKKVFVEQTLNTGYRPVGQFHYVPITSKPQWKSR